MGAQAWVTKSLSIRTLDLYSNAVGNPGAKALAAAAAHDSRCVVLDFWDNAVGDEGGEALASTLSLSSSLRELNLCWNHIGDRGAEALGAALLGNEITNLNFLCLW